jgi:hypothetical protein
MASLTQPSTLEDIANLALAKIGEYASITDLDTDTSEEAAVVNRFFAQVVQEVQAEFRWPELTKRTIITTAAGQDSDTLKYYYTLPTDYLRPADNNHTDNNYQILNGYIWTDETENFEFRYIRFSDDPSEWEPLLVKCVYFRLAIEICQPLSENIPRYNALVTQYLQEVEPKAHKVASFNHEKPNNRRWRNTWSRERGSAQQYYSKQ